MQQKLYISIRDFADLSVDDQQAFLQKLNGFRDKYSHYLTQFYWHVNNDVSALPTWRKDTLDWANEAIKLIRSNDCSVLALSTEEDKITLSDMPLIRLHGRATIFETHVDFINKNRAANVIYYTVASKENRNEIITHSPPLICDKKMSLMEALDDLMAREELLLKLNEYTSVFNQLIAWVKSLFSYELASQKQNIAEDLKRKLSNGDLKRVVEEAKDNNTKVVSTCAHTYSSVFRSHYLKNREVSSDDEY